LFFFSSRRRHTRFSRDWSSDVCSSDLDSLTMYADCEVKVNPGKMTKLKFKLVLKLVFLLTSRLSSYCPSRKSALFWERFNNEVGILPAPNAIGLTLLPFPRFLAL